MKGWKMTHFAYPNADILGKRFLGCGRFFAAEDAPSKAYDLADPESITKVQTAASVLAPESFDTEERVYEISDDPNTLLGQISERKKDVEKALFWYKKIEKESYYYLFAHARIAVIFQPTLRPVSGSLSSSEIISTTVGQRLPRPYIFARTFRKMLREPSPKPKASDITSITWLT